MKMPGMFDNMRVEGLFGKSKSDAERGAELKAAQLQSHMQQAGFKAGGVSVEVPQKAPIQKEIEKRAEGQKAPFIERFRVERAVQIEARQKEQSQSHKHSQR